MSNKYTIFDNFDKLDLGPVASIFRQDAKISIPSYLLFPSSINYKTLNETVFSNLSNKARPIAYNSSNMVNGPVPDMFWYITNNRFYIRNTGEIFHTSQIKELLSNADLFKQLILDSNIFYNHFFFNVFLSHFRYQFADAVMLYNNPFYSPNTSKIDENYTYSLGNYFIPNKDNLSNLDNFDPKTTPIHKNVPVFTSTEESNGKDDLIIEDLLKPPTIGETLQYASVMNYLRDLYPKVYEQSILFLQRLLYPYKTKKNLAPKHNYFVSDLEKTNNVFITSWYDYKPPEGYEDITLEWQLPNIYAFSSYITSEEGTDRSEYYKEIISLDSNQLINLDNISIKKYYDISLNSQDYLDAADNPEDDEYLKYEKLFRHRTTIFGADFEKQTDYVFSIKDKFSLYNEIKLPANGSGLMMLLEKVNAVEYFMSVVSNLFSTYEVPTLSAVHTFCLHNKNSENTDISLTDLQIIDLMDAPAAAFLAPVFWSSNKFSWLNYSKQNAYLDPTSDVIINDSQYSSYDLVDHDYNNVKHAVETYINSNTLTLSFDQIKKGEKCYSEILAYEVVKYSIVNGEKTRLQSFFIPCYRDKEKILIDTQVFYNKKYIYEVFSISLVVGCEYQSELALYNSALFKPNPTSPGGKEIYKFEEDDLLNFKVEDQGSYITDDPKKIILPEPDAPKKPVPTPKPIIIRAPFFNTPAVLGGKPQKETIILDTPPLPPDISFYPYKDIDNKILITLGVNYGKRRMMPIRVFPGDTEQIQKHYDSQKDLSVEAPFDGEIDSYLSALKKLDILYETETFEGTYKIWKTTEKPINWGAFYSSVPVEIENQSSTAFEDMISPNVDYYYFARFEDRIGNFSNPTDIFYLRMVREGGFPPYLIVKKYDFSEGRPPIVYEKSFKKYLKIRLADGTREFYNTDDPNKIDFGYKKANSNSQLKKYKIRITSKKTGKKLDINIDFNKDISNQYLANLFPSGLLQEIDLDLVQSQGPMVLIGPPGKKLSPKTGMPDLDNLGYPSSIPTDNDG